MSDTTRALVAGLVALLAVIGHSALTGTAAVASPEYRSDQPEEASTTTTQIALTPTTRPQVATTTTVATVVQAEQKPPSAPAWTPPPWKPSDECSRISRPVSAGAMRWCPQVANYLHRTGDWQPGDLTKLMRIMDCESRGRVAVVNPSSGTTGLFQHMPRYWADRGRKAGALFGFDNPTITMPHDDIAVGVWLYKFGGGVRHWPACGKR